MSTDNENIIESWRDFWDLPVPLSIELGRTHFTLREILEFETSSLIKLSRSSGEGVDVRVDDQPLVRGEIVVIEDHTGVRISEILEEK